MIRSTPLAIGLLLAGCGTPAPPSDMPARTWKYYVAHPAEIAAMQAICKQWSGANAPSETQPAVVATNCRGAGFAKLMIKLQNTGSK